MPSFVHWIEPAVGVGVIVHVAPVVTSIAPFAVAVKSCDPPLCPTPQEVGLTVRLEIFGTVTVAVAVPLKACALAVTVAVPGATPDKIPLSVPIEATADGVTDQDTPLMICLRSPLGE